jgi:hypothetical protein
MSWALFVGELFVAEFVVYSMSWPFVVYMVLFVGGLFVGELFVGELFVGELFVGEFVASGRVVV